MYSVSGLTLYIQRELRPGEVVLWSGAPGQGVRLRQSDLFLIPFSAVWCGLAIFWAISLVHNDASSLAKFCSALFIIIGLYMVVGRFIYDAIKRSSTVYAITNRRVIISHGPLKRATVLIELRALPAINQFAHADGSSTITFGPTVKLPGQRSSPAFEFIREKEQILRALNQTREFTRH